jgi:hypothetical protein
MQPDIARLDVIQRIRRMQFSSTFLFLVAVSLVLVGCKEGTLGPEITGSVSGTVLDYETSAPIAGASVTTSPPTGAIVTDKNGRFRLDDIDAGNYTISVKKPGFKSNSVTVNVRENRTTEATLFLEEDARDDEPSGASLRVDLLNWWNSTSNDSSFVNVEYRARNEGDQTIIAYEVYFRIGAGTETFYHEVTGSTLRASQSDVRQFARYLPNAPADSVDVDDIWVDS